MFPKVSVIVPVCNSEKYISKCIESILNQTYRDFELLIINDGSIDSSEKIIETYMIKDKILIKLLKNKMYKEVIILQSFIQKMRQQKLNILQKVKNK